MKKVIDHSSYMHCKEDMVIRAVEDIYNEYKKINIENKGGK